MAFNNLRFILILNTILRFTININGRGSPDQELPMGSSNTGTIIIVVIVLLALVAIIAGALIFYSKKNDLWCFAPEESTNTKVKTIWFHFRVSETRQAHGSTT